MHKRTTIRLDGWENFIPSVIYYKNFDLIKHSTCFIAKNEIGYDTHANDGRMSTIDVASCYNIADTE